MTRVFTVQSYEYEVVTDVNLWNLIEIFSSYKLAKKHVKFLEEKQEKIESVKAEDDQNYLDYQVLSYKLQEKELKK